MGTMTFIIVCILYFLPSVIAIGKKNSTGIFLLNLLLGWVILVWIGVLVWAACSPKR